MAATKTGSSWEVLSNIDVQGHINKKGNVDYIPWANAWSLLKSAYPNASRQVYDDPNTGMNYHTDGRYAYVKVAVRIDNLVEVDYLPIMDFRNKALPLEKITSMDVNKTIQRSTVKAIAMHGLGITLWSKEEEIIEKSPAPSKASTQSKAVLNKRSPNWEAASGYILENKSLGVDALVSKLEKRYKISAATKVEITKLVEG